MSPSRIAMQPRTSRGYLLALLSAAILSTTAILIRYLTVTYQLPALLLAFWRDLLVTLSLTGILAVFRPALLRLEPRHQGWFCLYGLVLAITNALWTLAVALDGAAVATVLVYSSVGFTAGLGWLFLKESLGLGKILGVGLSFLGCLLVSGSLAEGSWQTNALGILAGSASGLGYAIYSIMGRRSAAQGTPAFTSLLYTFGYATVFLALINVMGLGWLPGAGSRLADFAWLGQAYQGWGVLLLLAAGPTLLGFGLYNVSLGYLPSSVANLVVSLEPAFTALIAYGLLGERLTPMQLMGSVLILAAVGVVRLVEREPSPPDQGPTSDMNPAALCDSM